MRVLNAAQMREADARTIEMLGLPSLALMEGAGLEVCRVLHARFSDLRGRRVSVVCGGGNNAGDGFVVARALAEHGTSVQVYLAVPRTKVRGDAQVVLQSLAALEIPVVDVSDRDRWQRARTELVASDILVDALFGTGLRDPLADFFATVVTDLSSLGVPVVSIDLPSGLSAEDGPLIGPCVRADLTITMGAPKLGLVLPPGDAMAGEVVVAHIGIPRRVIESVCVPPVEWLTAADVRGLVPDRRRDSHKGDYGRVLIVAGSVGKTGAAHLTGRGALCSGAGLVSVATPRECLPVVAAMAPEYMTLGLTGQPGDGVEKDVEAILGTPHDVLVLGPGLGQESAAAALCRALLERSRVPLVIDADGLNNLAADLAAVAPGSTPGAAARPIVLTPHPGEMSRLCGRPTGDVQAHRLAVAREFAVARRMHVILKGHRSLIAGPDGDIAINSTGNPAMATGGAGDLLAGMVGAWIGQGLAVGDACRLATFLHGLAADLAREARGPVGVTATDIADHVGQALESLGEWAPRGFRSPITLG